jgi:DNA-directed RNA polymerase specialized sigma24 family protein
LDQAPRLGVEQILDPTPALHRYAGLLTGDATRADDLGQDKLERARENCSLWQPGPVLRRCLLCLMHKLHLDHARVSRSER